MSMVRGLILSRSMVLDFMDLPGRNIFLADCYKHVIVYNDNAERHEYFSKNNNKNTICITGVEYLYTDVTQCSVMNHIFPTSFRGAKRITDTYEKIHMQEFNRAVLYDKPGVLVPDQFSTGIFSLKDITRL